MNYAIVLSGGVGSRLRLEIPKQYYEVNKKPIIGYVIDTISQCDFIDGIVIVAAEEWHAYIQQQIPANVNFCGFALPGENRQMSIYNGMCLLRDRLSVTGDGIVSSERDSLDDAIVLIQDAARPNTSVELYRRCFSFAEDEDGAMPVLPMKDTVYVSQNGMQVSELLDRKTIFAGQAPESFRLGKYLEANEHLLPEEIFKINGSTEPAILAGMNIRMIEGDEHNYKITTETDLEKFCSEIM